MRFVWKGYKLMHSEEFYDYIVKIFAYQIQFYTESQNLSFINFNIVTERNIVVLFENRKKIADIALTGFLL